MDFEEYERHRLPILLKDAITLIKDDHFFDNGAVALSVESEEELVQCINTSKVQRNKSIAHLCYHYLYNTLIKIISHQLLKLNPVELSVARVIRHGHPHGYFDTDIRTDISTRISARIFVWISMKKVRGHGHSYGYPRPDAIYLDIHTDILADVRVELSMLRPTRGKNTNEARNLIFT